MSAEIRIRMQGELKSDAFIKAVTNFFRVAKHVSESMNIGPVDWIASVEQGSSVVVAQPRSSPLAGVPNWPAKIVSTVYRGVHSIASGNPQRPDFFNDSALEAMRAIATIEVDGIAIAVNGEAVQIESKAATTVDIILGSVHKSFGEVEGKLSVLSDHGGFKFHIVEPIHGSEVTCYITKDDLIDRAVAAFRKRVCAYGLVKYRRNGTPISVDVDDLRVFDDGPFPTTADIIGIYKKQ